MKEFVRKNKLLVATSIFIFVGILGIAYAAFTGNLNISGTGINRKSNYDIHFANLSSPTIVGTANVVTAPTIQNNNTVIEDYSITLATPKDSVSYTFDVVNDGDYDATLKGLTVGPVKCSVNGNENDQSAVNVCSNIEYTLKYADGSTLQPNTDKLLSKETKQLKLTLTYKEFNDASKLPTSNVSISNLGIDLVYEADSEAKTNPDGTTPLMPTYSIGDTVTIGTDNYYVIEDSGASKDYVTLLKENPLTVAEVNTYGTVDGVNHVNRYTSSSVGTAFNWKNKGYGGMAYYTSETCGDINGSSVETGCTTDYASSEIKYVVDAWSADKFQNNELKEVDGYSARLITKDEHTTLLSYSWRYNNSYSYWTMSPDQNTPSAVWSVNPYDNVLGYTVRDSGTAVRPVINVYKSAIQ